MKKDVNHYKWVLELLYILMLMIRWCDDTSTFSSGRKVSSESFTPLYNVFEDL